MTLSCVFFFFCMIWMRACTHANKWIIHHWNWKYHLGKSKWKHKTKRSDCRGRKRTNRGIRARFRYHSKIHWSLSQSLHRNEIPISLCTYPYERGCTTLWPMLRWQQQPCQHECERDAIYILTDLDYIIHIESTSSTLLTHNSESELLVERTNDKRQMKWLEVVHLNHHQIETHIWKIWMLVCLLVGTRERVCQTCTVGWGHMGLTTTTIYFWYLLICR